MRGGGDDRARPPAAPLHSRHVFATFLPPGLRSLLHRALDQFADSRMPNGKPAGVACVQLDAQLGCRLFGSPLRPAVCGNLRPSLEMCGTSRKQALSMLAALERATQP